MKLVFRLTATLALLLSFMLGTAAKSGYVICIEGDGSVKIEADHNDHCEGSIHHTESPELHESHDHSSHDICGSDGYQESYEESSSKIFEECFAHCLDIPISIQNTVMASSPKAEAPTGHSVQKEIRLVQRPKQILIGMGSPKCLKTLKLEKSQRLKIIRTVVLTV
jgi:hypothetical protein